jgi:hypothetical protein
VRTVYRSRAVYRERALAFFYEDKSQPERVEYIRRQVRNVGHSGAFWENVWRIDCMEFLTRVSGTDAVFGETYTFRKNGNGNWNILVNGKGTSCFIDKEFRIGSLSQGGPTVYAWLTWLGHRPGDAVRIIKDFYPEVGNV